MTDKSKQRIFSYLRRSTKKGEQESSIASQRVHVESMAQKLGIPLKRIEYYIDNGKSGYRGAEYKDSKSETIVRKRQGYSGMINEIRKQKAPCKVLAWTVSRIARDTKEGGTIYNLLGNNTKSEQRIESIHFLNGTVWNEKTSQTDIYQQISHEEESSREKSVWKAERINQALSSGLYPNEYKAPKGLFNTGVGTKSGIKGGRLEETEYMPFIYKAFEMKALGESNKGNTCLFNEKRY